MSEAPRNVNRILVAIDACSPGFEIFEAATELAAGRQIALQGLFVEDINLFRLAALPFAQEIGLATPVFRPFSPESLESRLRSLAAQLREALAEHANRARVPWSFQIARGHVVRLSLEVTESGDLLLFSPKSLAAPARRPARPPAQPIIVVFDGSASGERTLRTVLDLTQPTGGELLVVACPDPPRTVDDVARRAGELLHEAGLSRSYQLERMESPSTLHDLIRRRPPRLLFLNRDANWLDESTLQSLLNQVHCPIGLVR